MTTNSTKLSEKEKETPTFFIVDDLHYVPTVDHIERVMFWYNEINTLLNKDGEL